MQPRRCLASDMQPHLPRAGLEYPLLGAEWCGTWHLGASAPFQASALPMIRHCLCRLLPRHPGICPSRRGEQAPHAMPLQPSTGSCLHTLGCAGTRLPLPPHSCRWEPGHTRVWTLTVPASCQHGHHLPPRTEARPLSHKQLPEHSRTPTPLGGLPGAQEEVRSPWSADRTRHCPP